MKEHAIRQMLIDLADPVFRVLPREIGCSENQLRQLWQKGWGRACAESENDLVRLSDAACEELKMLILVSLMEDEQSIKAG